ncbi:hypothetical protein QTP86_025625 [Hemibagrus guttatus]|nr:hypothetical protein QTP86_025625 [Hemibagrus guttatus]
MVSSVKVSYRCSPPGIMEVTCAADGDNLHFTGLLIFLAPSTGERDQHCQTGTTPSREVTCHVENHVSRDYNTIELLQCPSESVL